MVFRLLCILFLTLSACLQGWAQEQKHTDTPVGEQSMEAHRHNTIVGKLFHRLIFNTNIREINQDSLFLELKPVPYDSFRGKIIRNIHFHVTDPFGYSLQDTSVQPSSFIQKTGNRLHISTRKKTFENLLLIHENEPFDSLLFKESERLIRARRYVQDVLAYTSVSASAADSVDVHIRVIDRWSIVPSLRLLPSDLQMGLADNNFLGMGNSLHFDTRVNKNIREPVVQFGYLIPNISNTHIMASLQYYYAADNDLIANMEFKRPLYSPFNFNLPTLTLSNRYLVKSVELSRAFFSPVARWAGGLFIGQLVTSQNYMENDSIRYVSTKTNITDLWGAWAWPVYKGNSLTARTTSMVVSGRILRTRYPDKPAGSEGQGIFNNGNFYFAGLGITSRSYIQDRYVFDYGKVEDIPTGRAFGLTTGLIRQKSSQLYLGLYAGGGNNYRYGYLSSHFEYGTFIGNRGFRQQAITGRMNYYTPLFSVGYWKIRQFIKPTAIIGINRLPTDMVTLSEEMEEFEELRTPATRMLVLTLQTQSYAPWQIYGFRFGPYFFSSLGMLGHKAAELSDRRLYAALGLGLLIKNNYLLINTFQVSLTYYPFLPGRGEHILNLNAYKTSDFGVHDFEIARPQVVDFR
ncbi:MAG TPA: hypothetical protein VFG54_01275 [Prolixibacteraceae bacterium]|nr:hypothetical protein [Prolixibacteraceae bacterium]